MASSRFGDLSLIGVLIAVVTLAAIIGVSYVSGGILFSPGKLSTQTTNTSLGGVSSHSEIQGNCGPCHTPPWGVETMDDRCKACHVSIEGQLLDDSSLHSILFEDTISLTCKECHPDHRGADASLTRLETDRFPHDAVGYSLTVHQTLSNGDPFTCADCHTSEITKFEVDSCTVCHQEIDAVYTQTHVETFGSQCLSCHDGVDIYGNEFDHNTFSLDGRHADLSCAACHLGAQSPSDLRATSQACVDCHVEDDGHDGEFGLDCGECHTPSSWEDATFDHSISAFPLEGKHTEVDCLECHIDDVFKGTPQECVDCHEEPAYHAGSFSSDCASCHTSDYWSPAEYNERHTFPINHESRNNNECRTCHEVNLESYTCYGCHEHTPSNVRSEHREEGISDWEDCVECHPTGRESDERGDD